MEHASSEARSITVARRALIVQRVLVDGWTSARAAAAFDVSERLVDAWVADYRRRGMTSLRRVPGKTVIAEIIDRQSEEDRESLRTLAEVLVVKLRESLPAIGLDISRLNALEVQLGNITVTRGTGARIEEATVETLKTGNISVGDRSGK